MADNYRYRHLVLDPRCLKPFYEIQNSQIYTDAIDAIDQALKHAYATESEKYILVQAKIQVHKNRHDY